MACLAAAGCGAEVLPVQVTFSVEDEPGCLSTEMSAIALNGDCGGTIEVHLTDESSPGRLFGSQCIDVDGQTHYLDELPDLIAPHFKVTAPVGSVASLQISAHSSPRASTCADVPRRLLEDQPVLAGESEPVTLGEGAVLDVALTCPSRPRSCVVAPVVDDQVAVAAGVRDLMTLDRLDNSRVLDVSFGYVMPDVPSTWQLVRELIYAEELMWDTPHRFVLADPLPGNCFGTRVNWTDDETLTTSSFLSCEGTLVGTNLTTQGYFVEPARVQQIVQALGHQRIPPGGLLIGRVVDESSQPVAGMVVRAEGASTVVVNYFTDETPMQQTLDSTSRNGLFAVDAWQPGQLTCCRDFTAQSSALLGRTEAPVGLAKGLVTTSLIRVAPRNP